MHTVYVGADSSLFLHRLPCDGHAAFITYPFAKAEGMNRKFMLTVY